MKIIITGATAGIGQATAERLHQEGHELWLLARRQERLQNLQKKLGSDRVKITAIDLTLPEKLEQLARDEAATFAKTQVLINNAGLAKGVEKIQEGHLADWQTMINTNVMALLSLSRLVLPHFIANRQGHVVNLGSVAGRWVYPGGAVYCASKFAVRALSEGMRMDLAGHNIRVTNIEPGMVNTEFSLVRLGDQAKADAVYAGMKPLTAEDIAETISWVLSRPSHVNVQELVIYPTAQAHVGQVHRG